MYRSNSTNYFLVLCGVFLGCSEGIEFSKPMDSRVPAGRLSKPEPSKYPQKFPLAEGDELPDLRIELHTDAVLPLYYASSSGLILEVYPDLLNEVTRAQVSELVQTYPSLKKEGVQVLLISSSCIDGFSLPLPCAYPSDLLRESLSLPVTFKEVEVRRSYFVYGGKVMKIWAGGLRWPQDLPEVEELMARRE